MFDLHASFLNVLYKLSNVEKKLHCSISILQLSLQYNTVLNDVNTLSC